MAEIIQSPTPVMVSSPKHVKRGIFWLVGPTILLIFTLALYSVATFIATSLNVTEGSDQQTIFNLTQIVLGFLGIIDVIALIIGIPLGIINLVKKIPASNIPFDVRSGKGNASVIPEEIKGWNWGAAGLTWIWGFSHGVWLSALTFIPVVSLFMWVILGIKGNEWAWSAQPWVSVEAFKRDQAKWKVWGIVMFILTIVLIALPYFIGSETS